MSGTGRIMLFGALLAAAAGFGVAAVRAQTVLGDPRDAARTFASNCSACHKSPRGLAKSGQVAGFLRQHYTTGPEMSAAMAAYLVAAGAAPPEKKAAAADAKTKGKKQEQLSAAQPGSMPDPGEQRTLRGKQRPTKSDDVPAAAPASVAAQPAAEETTRQATASAAVTAAPSASAAPAEPAPVVFDVPMPALPEGPPADLVQSVFSSSPLP